MFNAPKGLWAIILGGSSGFGLASAHSLAKLGLNLIIVHRDRRASAKVAEEEFNKMRELGVEVKSYNSNALDDESRKEIIEEVKVLLKEKKGIRLLLHSIAMGSLKPLVSHQNNSNILSDEDLDITVYSMATSLMSWVRDIYQNNLFHEDSRIIGLTSEGNQKALEGYAAVSCAKATLEALNRSLAKEFGPYGIRSNLIQAGCTLTPSFKIIPEHERIAEQAIRKNPLGRLTTPSDIAEVIAFLATDQARWINGSILTVDGGESICG